MAGSDYLLVIDKVRGESKDQDFPDSIEVKGWSYGAISPTDPVNKLATGQPQFSDLTIVKGVDKTSPHLLERLGRNMVADTAALICRKSGGDAHGYLRIEMKKVRVRSVSVKAAEAAGIMPVETLVLSYQKIKWIYKEQAAQGSMKGDVEYEHDAAANR